MSSQNGANSLKKITSSFYLFIFRWLLEYDEVLTFLDLYVTILNKVYIPFSFYFLFSAFWTQTRNFRLLKRCDYKNSTIVSIAVTCAGYCFRCYHGNTSNYVKYYRRNLRVPKLQLSALVSTIQFSVGTSHTTHSWLYRLQSSRHMLVTGEQRMWKAGHCQPCHANYAPLPAMTFLAN